MKILFLPKYGTLGASSRYRIYQYLDKMRHQGITCDVYCLLGDWYIHHLYNRGSKLSKLHYRIPLAYLHRLIQLRDALQYDIVYVEKELFPYFPVDFEGWLQKRGVKLVVDYDDAVFHSYETIPFLKHKIPRVMTRCSAIFVGNQYLAEYARSYNKNVYIVPTCIDVKKYRVKPNYSLRENTVVVGWIGSPATEHYLQLLGESLRKLSEEFKLIVKCIGVSQKFDLLGVQVKKVPWSEATEVDELLDIDIGVMPLTDDPFSRGKCGLKLLQYMACGIPVIGSPVGVNNEIIKDGENGFLASNEEEWIEKIRILMHDEKLRMAMGQRGREIVQSTYSLESGFRKLLTVFKDVLAGI